jgi:hypothetical protein
MLKYGSSKSWPIASAEERSAGGCVFATTINPRFFRRAEVVVVAVVVVVEVVPKELQRHASSKRRARKWRTCIFNNTVRVSTVSAFRAARQSSPMSLVNIPKN